MPTTSNEWSNTGKDEDSRDAVFHDEDILPEGCGKGAGEDNASAAADVQAHKHKRTSPTAKKASVMMHFSNGLFFSEPPFFPETSHSFPTNSLRARSILPNVCNSSDAIPTFPPRLHVRTRSIL